MHIFFIFALRKRLWLISWMTYLLVGTERGQLFDLPSAKDYIYWNRDEWTKGSLKIELFGYHEN